MPAQIRPCGVRGCPGTTTPYGTYCNTHSTRQKRHGHPQGRAVTPQERRGVSWVRDALLAYRHTRAVQAALEQANNVLWFHPRHGWTWEVTAQERMAYLRDCGVQPLDVLTAVVEVAALSSGSPHRFQSARVEHVAMARAVLRLRSMHKWRPSAPLLRLFGSHLSDKFAVFNAAFLARLEQEALDRSKLSEAMTDFAPNTGVPTK